MNASKTEKDAVRKEMTFDEMAKLPGVNGPIISQVCRATGEYKCVYDGVKTHFVLVLA